MTAISPSKYKAAAWLLAAAVLIVLSKTLNVQEILRKSLEGARDLGPGGMAVFVLVYVLACVLLLPGSVLTLGAGAVFGLVKGSAIVSLASTMGATLAFLTGRFLVREWVESKMERRPGFKAVDEAVAREGWKIVLLTRLSPVFPFNLLNYAYGLTRVSLRDYVLASWIGMMPGTVMFVYIGSLAGDAALGGGANAGPAPWAVRAAGLAATVAVTVYVARIAKKAMREKINGSL